MPRYDATMMIGPLDCAFRLFAVVVLCVTLGATPAHARGTRVPGAGGAQALERRGPEDVPRHPGRLGGVLDPAGSPDRALADSTSLGPPWNGVLIDGVELPEEGDAWVCAAFARQRRTHFATRELVVALEQAAQTVRSLFPAARLLVGNMSRQHGGKIPWSVSHTSGRDVDVAFYVVDVEGHDVPLEHFVRISRRGYGFAGGKKVYFDAARNWAFTAALLSNRDIQVQWIFVANHLKQRMLAYAREHAMDPQLIARAERVLHQPTDSSPHADHFHVRLYCSRDDVLEGCIQTGPVWAWVDDFEADRIARVTELREALAQALDRGEVDTMRALLPKLVRLRAQAARDVIRRIFLRGPRGLQGDAFDALAKLGGLDRPLLEHLLADRKAPRPLRIRAIRELAYTGNRRTVALLIDHLDDPARPVRDAIRHALAYLTNRNFKVPRGKGSAVARLKRRWKRWYRRNRGDIWAQWMREGFEHAGIWFGRKMMRRRSIPTLIRAVRRGGYLGYNAQRVLVRLTGRQVDARNLTGTRAYLHWRRWWKQQRRHRHHKHRKRRRSS